MFSDNNQLNGAEEIILKDKKKHPFIFTLIILCYVGIFLIVFGFIQIRGRFLSEYIFGGISIFLLFFISNNLRGFARKLTVKLDEYQITSGHGIRDKSGEKGIIISLDEIDALRKIGDTLFVFYCGYKVETINLSRYEKEQQEVFLSMLGRRFSVEEAPQKKDMIIKPKSSSNVVAIVLCLLTTCLFITIYVSHIAQSGTFVLLPFMNIITALAFVAFMIFVLSSNGSAVLQDDCVVMVDFNKSAHCHLKYFKFSSLKRVVFQIKRKNAFANIKILRFIFTNSKEYSIQVSLGHRQINKVMESIKSNESGNPDFIYNDAVKIERADGKKSNIEKNYTVFVIIGLIYLVCCVLLSYIEGAIDVSESIMPLIDISFVAFNIVGIVFFVLLIVNSVKITKIWQKQAKEVDELILNDTKFPHVTVDGGLNGRLSEYTKVVLASGILYYFKDSEYSLSFRAFFIPRRKCSFDEQMESKLMIEDAKNLSKFLIAKYNKIDEIRCAIIFNYNSLKNSERGFFVRKEPFIYKFNRKDAPAIVHTFAVCAVENGRDFYFNEEIKSLILETFSN